MKTLHRMVRHDNGKSCFLEKVDPQHAAIVPLLGAGRRLCFEETRLLLGCHLGPEPVRREEDARTCGASYTATSGSMNLLARKLRVRTWRVFMLAISATGNAEVVSAAARLCALGSDTRIEAQLRFNDVSATMVADIQDPPSRSLLRIEGEQGVIELDNPCLPHRGHSLRESISGQYREYTIAGGTTYDYQIAAFLNAIDTGAPLPTGGKDSIGNMIALDRIYEIAGVARPG